MTLLLAVSCCHVVVSLLSCFFSGCRAVNVQELATAAIEKLNIKILLLNNQHLGMVVQWEDRFYKVSDRQG